MKMRSLAAALLLCLGFVGAERPAQGQTLVNPTCNTIVSLYPSASRGQPFSVDQFGATCINGSITASLSGFTPAGTFATLTATASSASVALPAGATVVFDNTGTTAVSCTLGVGSATALASENIIQPSSWKAFTVGTNTFGACIDQTGSASNLVVLSGGAGLPTGAGGGGGSGGGGAITAASGSYASGALSSGSVASGAFASGSISSGAVASGAVASGALAVGSGTDGWDVSTGITTATAATVGSVGSVNAKLRLMTTQLDAIQTSVAGAIPAGTNAIGSLTAGTAIIGKVGIDQTTPGTTNGIRTTAGATGGGTLTSAIAPATPAGVNLKASAGTVFRVFATTIQATPVYIKFYNSASAPTCGSGTPVGRFMVPAASTAANGAGTNIDIGDIGAAFGTGIGYCVTGALADADTTAITASNTLVNIVWN